MGICWGLNDLLGEMICCVVLKNVQSPNGSMPESTGGLSLLHLVIVLVEAVIVGLLFGGCGGGSTLLNTGQGM